MTECTVSDLPGLPQELFDHGILYLAGARMKYAYDLH